MLDRRQDLVIGQLELCHVETIEIVDPGLGNRLDAHDGTGIVSMRDVISSRIAAIGVTPMPGPVGTSM